MLQKRFWQSVRRFGKTRQVQLESSSKINHCLFNDAERSFLIVSTKSFFFQKKVKLLQWAKFLFLNYFECVGVVNLDEAIYTPPQCFVLTCDSLQKNRENGPPFNAKSRLLIVTNGITLETFRVICYNISVSLDVGKEESESFNHLKKSDWEK